MIHKNLNLLACHLQGYHWVFINISGSAKIVMIFPHCPTCDESCQSYRTQHISYNFCPIVEAEMNSFILKVGQTVVFRAPGSSTGMMRRRNAIRNLGLQAQNMCRYFDDYLPGRKRTVFHTKRGLSWRNAWGVMRYSANNAFLCFVHAQHLYEQVLICKSTGFDSLSP